MARLIIREYDKRGIASGFAPLPIAKEPALRTQPPLDFSSGVGLSEPFSADTRYIRVDSDVTCSIAIGSAPVATTADARMFGKSIEYFGVNPGDRLSVIASN